VNGTCQAACSTLQCGGTCCAAPATASCCGTACPFEHKNFPGTTQEQTYWSCTVPGTYDVVSAQAAAAVWMPDGLGVNTVSLAYGCPNLAPLSRCVIRTRDATISGASAQCGVFCYEGPYAGAATVTQGSSCVCPATQQIDWY
jgi:hypothetical protein